MPVIAGWGDAPLALEDLAKAVCIIKLYVPIGFKHKFHDNKRVSNSPLQGTENRSPDWQHAVVTTIRLAYVSLLILLCADIQLQVLK